MFGEIRDPLSASAAMDAAATGKVLLSTLHSRDAVGGVISFRNYGVKDHEIAALLETVVAQRLVRKLCDSCKKETTASDNNRAWLNSIGRKDLKTLFAANPEGCEVCGGVGYKGRIGIFEV
jgi:general secretion pathway protein E